MRHSKLLALFLALVMILGLLAGCGDNQSAGSNDGGSQTNSSPAPAQNDGGSAPAEPVSKGKDITIGLLGTIWTNSFEKNEREYIEQVLAPAFPNVTFIFSESYNSIEGQRDQLESLIMQGCEGIICSVCYDFTSALETCSSNGVYFTVTQSAPAKSQSDTWGEDMLKYFPGYAATTPEQEGEMMQVILEKADVSAANGPVCVYGKPGTLSDGCDALRLQTIKAVLGDQYNEDYFFKVDFSDVAATLALGGDMCSLNPYAIISTYQGLPSMCSKVILGSGRADEMFVGSVGAMDTLWQEAIRGGSVDFFMAQTGETVAGSFVLLYNALNDGVVWRNDDGSFVVCGQMGFPVDSEATLDAYLAHTVGGSGAPMFTADDVKSCLVQYNPDANAQDWAALFSGVTLEEIEARNS